MPTADELYKEGVALKDEKKYEEAVAKLQEAYALNEKDTLPLHAQVQALTELGRHEESIAMAKKIVDLEPDDQFSYIALSRAYVRAEMIPEAEYAMMQGQQAQMRAQAQKTS
ncbi:Tetratricopeptide repeat protein [Planctomycetes bacterium Pan216]|uniref:Tetratricopeptide repeat protein n=1 Tax=Kolteria novifilia TaxID=2527975 RepID=A0A518B705_9BACT|nr:Tetratricopeptide repeat protein [Planctomycetes bacterium Pan216]